MFVCLGNICRSPMAEYLFKDKVAKLGRQKEFDIKSAATNTWEIGNPVHYGTRKILSSLGEKEKSRCDERLGSRLSARRGRREKRTSCRHMVQKGGLCGMRRGDGQSRRVHRERRRRHPERSGRSHFVAGQGESRAWRRQRLGVAHTERTLFEMKILLLGDIVGSPGRRIVKREIPLLKKTGIGAVVANAENAAAGSGITAALARELFHPASMPSRSATTRGARRNSPGK